MKDVLTQRKEEGISDEGVRGKGYDETGNAGTQTWVSTAYKRDKARKARRIHVMDLLECQGEEFIHILESQGGGLLKAMGQKNHCITCRQEEGIWEQRAGWLGIGKNGR